MNSHLSKFGLMQSLTLISSFQQMVCLVILHLRLLQNDLQVYPRLLCPTVYAYWP